MGKQRKKPSKRGYPVAVALSIYEKKELQATLWQIFSSRIQGAQNYNLGRKFQNSDEKQKYHFFETLVNIIRPEIRQGVKALILFHPRDLDISTPFLEHLQKHHQWLFRQGKHQITLQTFHRRIKTLADIKILQEMPEYASFFADLLLNEAESALDFFEDLMNNPHFSIYYTFEEAEPYLKDLRDPKSKSSPLEYIFLTSLFRETCRKKQHMNNFLQMAQNLGVHIKTFDSDTPMGARLSQFGGLVIFHKSTNNNIG
ncbi:MAG: hypothetical protein E4G98_01825 [Promethearchaeota archaeon]|nr:MAG: hypothetical protein E4G98_01825 [Candidatus Lokiarchaeota archaeon]